MLCDTLLATSNDSVNITDRFSSTFAKSRKAIIRFVMPLCPSAWKSSAPTGRIIMKFDVRVFFENLSRKTLGFIEIDKNNEYFA
jgi:hypothetical protein